MPEHPSVQELWKKFLEKYPRYQDQVYKEAYYFCDNEKDANECAELVVQGHKRATGGINIVKNLIQK